VTQQRRQTPAAQQPRDGSQTPRAANAAEEITPRSAGGDGTGGGRRGRGNFAERMASMTPEERERFMERMRARGFTPPTDGQPVAAAPGGRGQGPRTQAQATAARSAAPKPQAQGATTFDALFGPLAQTETSGQVWLNVGGKLQRVRTRLGVSDGQQTELIQAMEGDLTEGTEVVTNVITGAVRQTPATPGGAAFPGLGGRQGFPGGGNRGGRGGG
jgi:hypothetical protein